MKTIHAACTLALFASGCTQTTAIRPSELPRLNGAYAVQVGSHDTVTRGPNGQSHYQSTPIIGQTVHQAVGPDGRVVEIKGPYDVLVTREGGSTVDFEHPVQSAVDGNILRVRGGNRAEVEFRMSDIAVEVEQHDPTRSMLLGGAIGLAVVLVSVL